MLRKLARWAATLVVVLAWGFALFALVAWVRTAFLPYNSEGRYFDPESTLVYYDAEPQFWGVTGLLAFLAGVVAAFVRRTLRAR